MTGGRVPFPSPLERAATAYVGRAALLDGMTEQCERARLGSTSALLLAGEPGVGKTRTAAEVARRAYEQGATVLYGGCDEGLGAPYQPFVEALRWYTSGRREDIGTLGRRPGELVRLLRDLPNRVGQLPAVVESDPNEEQHRLFEAVTWWLIEAAEPNGLVLVLDDLHWASKPTLLLAVHLLLAAGHANAKLFVIIGYRDTEVGRGHPLARVLTDMRGLPGVERVPLDNLAEDEVVAFIEASAGHPLGDAGRALGAAVYAETEGNPFFVAEVLRHLVEVGDLQQVEDRWIATRELDAIAIPEGVRDVVGRRLNRLTPTTNDVLTVAAVEGREADLDVLVAASDVSEADVLDALDEAVAAGVLEETGVGRFRFSHALVRKTLYDELLVTRRRRLHRRVADAIEKLHPQDVVGLAFHCTEAGSEGDDLERAVRYGLAAAEQSQAARAFADAEDRYRAVLEMLDGITSRERVLALCGLGECQRDQADRGHRGTLLEAARLAAEIGDTALLVRAVLATGRGIASIIGQVDEERSALINLALDAVGPGPSADRARLLAELSSEVTYGGDHARRRVLADEAEAIARAIGDDAVLARVLVHTGYSAVVPREWERWVERASDAIRYADLTGDPALRALARVMLYGAQLFAGRIEEAFAARDDAVALADAECSPATRWLVHVSSQAPNVARVGAIGAAARNDEILVMGQDAGQDDALQWWGAAASTMYWLRGEGGDVADAAGMFAAQYPGLPVWYSGYTWMLIEGGRVDEARAVVAAHLRGQTFEDNSLPLTGTHQLAAVAWELDDAELAAQLVPVLENYVGRWSHYFVVPIGPVVWGLGAALSVLGEYDRAVELVQQAVDELLLHGFRDHAVHARMHLARILLRADRPGDRTRADDALRAAREHADTIPAPRLVERIDALLSE